MGRWESVVVGRFGNENTEQSPGPCNPSCIAWGVLGVIVNCSDNLKRWFMAMAFYGSGAEELGLGLELGVGLVRLLLLVLDAET